MNDVEAAAREGLHVMAPGGGLIYAAWLDLRQQGMRLYGAGSRDWGCNVVEERADLRVSRWPHLPVLSSLSCDR